MGELSAFDLTGMIEKFDLSIYVETGTGVGISLAHALRYPFKKFYSVDIDEGRAGAQHEKYKDNLNISIVCDNSTNFLENIVRGIPPKENVLWFLDAHFPKADFDKMPYDESMRTYMELALPLKDELDIIRRNRWDHDVIIIDDLILFEDGPFEHNKDGGWKFKHIQEELGLLKSTDFIEVEFGLTHNIERDYRNQGYLILTPKVI